MVCILFHISFRIPLFSYVEFRFFSFLQNIITTFQIYTISERIELSLFGYDVLGLIGLIIIGLVIIFVIRLLFILIPAALIALVVWFLTGSLWWAGLAFLVIAALSILKKLW